MRRTNLVVKYYVYNKKDKNELVEDLLNRNPYLKRMPKADSSIEVYLGEELEKKLLEWSGLSADKVAKAVNAYIEENFARVGLFSFVQLRFNTNGKGYEKIIDMQTGSEYDTNLLAYLIFNRLGIPAVFGKGRFTSYMDSDVITAIDPASPIGYSAIREQKNQQIGPYTYVAYYDNI